MTSARSDLWVVRLLRVSSALTLAAAVFLWVRPINVPTRGGRLQACGSPADPQGQDNLFDLVCGVALREARVLSIGLAVAAGLTLLLGEAVVPRWPRPSRAFTGPLALSTLGLPIVAVAISSLFVTLGGVTETGDPFRCGTALIPAQDSVSVMLCGQLAEIRRVTAGAGVILGLGLIAGGGYVVRATREGESSYSRGEPDAPGTELK